MRKLALHSLGALALMSCEVGAPLVDRLFDDEPMIGGMQCAPPPMCEELKKPTPPTTFAEAIRLNACGGNDVCRAVSDEDAGLSEREAAVGCSEVRELPLQASCVNLDLALPADAREERTVTLEGADWNNVNVALINPFATPLHVTLRDATLQNVFVRLTGNVELEIDAPRIVQELRVAGHSLSTNTEERAPRLHLEQVDAYQVSVGEEAQPFAGTVSMHRTKITDATLQAATLNLESANLTRVRLQTRDLTLIDLDIEYGLVTTERGLISAFHGQEVWFSVCRDTRVIDASLIQSYFETCAGATTLLYDARVNGGELEGSYHMDMSTAGGVRFGATLPSEVVAFQSSFNSVALCSGLQRLALGNFSEIQCSRCVDEFVTETRICSLPEPPDPNLPNFCAALPFSRDVPEFPPACPPDVPSRTRPRAEPGL